ncbi:class E sortase [Streptomyces sp. TR02-1]|uniref:class E sortase n=1 Tax=Streptomyces sp. TR02-1 TaxID=3385977 RepID=UPI0039A18B22
MTQGRPGEEPRRDPYGDEEYRHGTYDGRTAGSRAYEEYGRDPYGVGSVHQDGGRGGGAVAGSQNSWEAGGGATPWESALYQPYAPRHDDYRAAVDALRDPLTDPLPSGDSGSGWGETASSWTPEGSGAQGGAHGAGAGTEPASPWFRPSREPGQGGAQAPQSSQAPQPPQRPQEHQGQWGRQPHPQHRQPHPQQSPPQQPQQPHPQDRRPPQQQGGPPPGRRRPQDAGGTMAMPAVTGPGEPSAPRGGGSPGVPGSRAGTEAEQGPGAERSRSAHEPSTEVEESASRRPEPQDDGNHTVAFRRLSEEDLSGRAARRRTAAKGAAPARAMTRLEARRAARAAKDGPAVLLSRAIGEVFITCGVLMLLFVAYQLWWTNILADNYAGGARDNLTRKWEQDPERKPGAFSPGQGFAIMYIPKLDVVVPVAQGTDKESVLDRGLVGHYDEASGVKTAMPWDKQGNFGVAGHRNTHGEPFRYVNRLVAGDKVIVETADTYYVYEMYSRLPSTPPSNVSVLDDVPPQSGFDEPGRYLTLTTCTPEFTSRYRLIVWGRMVSERPRSEGKPDALVE